MKVSETHNLLRCYPEVAKSIDFDATMKAWVKEPKKYAHITCLEDCSKITHISGKRAIFRCLNNVEHDNWDALIGNRTNLKRGCPQCAGRTASKENNLLIYYPNIAKSIDFNATAKVWEKDHKKYAHITCLEDCSKITPKTDKHAIFKCLKNTEHDNWDSRISHRSNGSGCPKCSAILGGKFLTITKIKNGNNLLIRYPEIAKSIDFEKTLKMWKQDSKKYAHLICLEDCSKITPCTKKRAIFKCLKNIEHDNWDAVIGNRTKLGNSCPQCAGQVASKENNLLVCYSEVAKSIDFNATIKAWKKNPKKYAHITCLEDCSEITPCTSKRAIFKCLKNPEHDNWGTSISNRTTKKSDCPQCANANSVSKEEKTFKNELIKILQLKNNEYKTNARIIPNFKQNVKHKLELDFVCEKLRIAVEFNGKYWHSDKVIRKGRGVSADFYHRYKFEQAKKLGLTLLFVKEQDWKNNKENVLAAIRNYCFKHTEKIPEILQLPA